MDVLNRGAKDFWLAADKSVGASRFVLLFPWLIFLGMGLITVRLLYQAWQEQAVLDALAQKIKQEKLLRNQKEDFTRLSSHYLRTPLTLITAGLEAMAGQSADMTWFGPVKQLSDKLQLGVSFLLESGDLAKLKPADKLKAKPNYNPSLYLTISLTGAFIIISFAVYLLAHLDTSAFKLNNLLSEIVLLLLTLVLLYSSSRSKSNRQTVKKYYEDLLKQQRQLDRQRNQLVRGSLESLRQPLEELKLKLNGSKVLPVPQAVTEGVRTFETVLRQFTILTSLEAGSMQTVIKPVSLTKLIQSVAERYHQQLAQKSLQLRIDIKANELKQDPLLVEFVLNSLIDNAVEYSRQGGHIDIISRQVGVNTDIFVRDDGQAVAPNELAGLFKPFSRAEAVEQFEHRGLGLSLYLDKLVIHYLGGGIKAESAKPSGLTIKLRLPTNASR